MKISGSMERAFITKSGSQRNLRQIAQWTAAVSLVATGTLALISTSTIDKLSKTSSITVDLTAFKKLSHSSMALARMDDEKIFAEETRLLGVSKFAVAEELPQASTRFRKISVKKQVSLKIAQASAPRATSTLFSKAEAAEIADLEKAVDPQTESRLLASVYRRVRFQFLAMDQTGYESESIAIAEKTPAYEYEEIPALGGDPEKSPGDQRLLALSAIASPEDKFEKQPVSMDLLPEGVEVASVDSKAISASNDAIQMTASSRANISSSSEQLDEVPQALEKLPQATLTANAAVMNAMNDVAKPSDRKVDRPSRTQDAMVSSFQTTSLDAIPESADLPLDSQLKQVTIQKTSPPPSTGPPKQKDKVETHQIATLPPTSDVATTIHVPNAQVSANKSSVSGSSPAGDLGEYSADVASIYDLAADTEGTSQEENSDYSFHSENVPSVPVLPVQTIHRALGDHSTLSASYGNGITQDRSGISIDWNAPSAAEKKVDSSFSPSKIYVGIPAPTSASPTKSRETEISLAKFSFESPKGDVKPELQTLSATAESATVTELSLNASKQVLTPAVQLKKCETARIGVEAFVPSADKESLTVCQRALTLEGLASGNQARWWEVYGTEKEHWPTLIFSKPGELTSENRVPMLSNASIRILSVVSHMNTHEGTGILFGETPRGVEVELLGRADAPIYLDQGLRNGLVENSITRPFVFLNVQPGQPLLSIRDSSRGVRGAIPLMVKSGLATFVKIPKAEKKSLSFLVLDASSRNEKTLPNLTGEIVGQSGKVGISDRKGILKISDVSFFGDYPVFVDLLTDEKSYKNRYRVRLGERDSKTGLMTLFYFNEIRVSGWLKQLAGGVSPYSGVIAGVVPYAALPRNPKESRTLRIGTFDKKSSLIPERYLLDASDQLISTPNAQTGLGRFIGVQVPEGAAAPTLVDERGTPVWSELVYAQPGVINVVGP
ncbi:MAG: hypothetical protein H7301_00600 [Cryobacterium sp.]|nr:hypothetical protein [Oligoflexia bacterium]